jgi:MFS family permease
LIGLMVREKTHEPQPHIRLWTGIQGLPGEFKRYLVGVGVAGLGDFSNTLLILWATQAWTPSLGLAGAARRAMLFYIGYNVLYTLSCYVSGGLADRFPKRWVLATGYSLAVIPALALIFAGDSLALYAVAFGFSGVYMGVWETVESATSAGMIPGNLRGTGFGVLATVNGIGDFFSSAMVGALWVFSPVAAMVFVILASLIGAAIIAAPPLGRAIRKG